MKTTSIFDSAADWHWGVLALIIGVFACFAVASAVRGESFLSGIALFGIIIFGKSAWRKYCTSRSNDSLAKAPSDSAQASSLNLKTGLLIGVLGWVLPIYLFASTGKLSVNEIIDAWPIFLMLWLPGILITSFFIFLLRIVNPAKSGRNNS